MTVRTTWRCRGQLLAEPGTPVLRVMESAYLPCGCTVHVARRVDNDEGATGAVPCSTEHRPLIAAFNVLLFDSLSTPTDRPLLDVVAEYLERAADQNLPDEAPA